MLPFDYPYIRDELVIDDAVQSFYDGFVGGGPVYLLGRVVRHARTLRVGTRPIVIVADLYDGSGGGIDASGSGGAGGAAGAHGAGAGASGGTGGTGGSGFAGGDVTVYCRRSTGVQISANGGWGGRGGDGGNGADGTPDGGSTGHWETVDLTPDDPSDAAYEDVWVDGEVYPGVVGGRGGTGGTGGNGAVGGTIRFTSIADDSAPVLDARGGSGGGGGWGGTGGMFAGLEEDGTTVAPPGGEGSWGADGAVSVTTVSEPDHLGGLRPVLGAYANYWAPFRLAVGEWSSLRHVDVVVDDDGTPPPDDGLSERAAVEFQRTLELQPDNAEALRLQRQLESGVNALGLDPRLDVVPDFESYITAFTGFGALALSFVSSGTGDIVDALTLGHLAGFAEDMRLQAAAARDAATDQLATAKTEHGFAAEEIGYAEQRVDQASTDITVEIDRMKKAALQSDGWFGTVAEVGIAVVGVIAAVPTAGASLVALVPTMATLASTVLKDAAPIANAVLNGTDVDVSNITAAYKKIGKEAPAAVAAGAKSVVNFVSVIQKLTAAKTADNARYVDLVRRGVEMTHELLLAQRRAGLAQQRIDAVQNQIGRAQGLVDAAASLRDAAHADASALRAAGAVTLGVAQAAAASLLGFAFRAQRAVEIYTLAPEGGNVHLDTGMLEPGFIRAYQEGRRTEAELVGAVKASWNRLMDPIALQSDYVSYFDNAPDSDQLRLTFAADGPAVRSLRDTGRLSFRVDVADLPAGRYDTKVVGARVAVVGAAHPNGEISTQLRHGARYEQRRPDGTVAVQLLAPRTSTRKTVLTALPADPGFDPDPPLTAPTSFRLWGRGLGGEWELSIPDDQKAGLDLSGVSAVQVWLAYRFVG